MNKKTASKSKNVPAKMKKALVYAQKKGNHAVVAVDKAMRSGLLKEVWRL